MQRHTSRAFAADLERLTEKILRMGALVEEAITKSLQSLVERDPEMAKACSRDDKPINQLEIEIDELCVEILALRQPVAADLRLITTGLKITTDLERIGDLAVNISQRSLELMQASPLKPLIDLPRMAEVAGKMLRMSLDAYVSRNPDVAEQVLKTDDEVDQLNDQILRELLTYMMEDPHTITRALGLIMVSRYLERIADHATNIAEMVIFLVRGKDVRHRVARGSSRSPNPLDDG